MSSVAKMFQAPKIKAPQKVAQKMPDQIDYEEERRRQMMAIRDKAKTQGKGGRAATDFSSNILGA